MANLLQVENLVKSFKDEWLRGSKTILHGVSFGVPEGKTTGFVGVNGSGKTTTLMCLFGFIRPDTGRVLYAGKELSMEARRHIGFLPERPQFPSFLTGYEFLKYHWDLSGLKVDDEFEARANELLELVLLTPAKDRTIRTYSKGMVQRIGLCQALLTRPKLLILDEPMSGLDPDGRLLVRRLIQSAAQEGTTIFFSSHLMRDIEDLCTDVVVIDRGHLLYSGDLAALQTDNSERYVVRVTHKEHPVQEVIVDVSELQDKVDEYRSNGFSLVEIRRMHRPLEDVFQSLRDQRSNNQGSNDPKANDQKAKGKRGLA